MVMKTLKDNSDKAKQLILEVVPRIAEQDWSDTLAQNEVRHAVLVLL